MGLDLTWLTGEYLLNLSTGLIRPLPINKNRCRMGYAGFSNESLLWIGTLLLIQVKKIKNFRKNGRDRWQVQASIGRKEVESYIYYDRNLLL